MISRKLLSSPSLLQRCSSLLSKSVRCLSVPDTSKREEALFHFIKDKIRSTGPITVHEYMQLAAGSGAGYYYNKNAGENDKIFGAGGDFITSPELTQVFGELVAIWIYNELANTGHRGEWHLVELGPGSGTLMSDILRVMQRFQEDKLTVHLVEISDNLIDTQEKLLCGSVSKNVEGKSYVRKSLSLYGVTVYWHKEISDIPDGFSKSKTSWHEVYVNLNQDGKLCFMLSKGENLHTKGILPESIKNDESRRHFEVSPEACTIVSQVSDMITKNGGFALFIDYGHDGSRRDLSLRAYHKHQQVNPLENPGRYDLTTDVNFGYLENLIKDQALVFGPSEQRFFLAQLGILARMQYLMKQCKTKEERQSLFNAYKMLMTSTEEGGMGTAFKCFSIFPKSLTEIMQKRGGYPDGFRPMNQATVEPSKDPEK
ncbi:hypothetical protein FO519_002583 [Halicephalobus sp. NKZ332]|nr:hypothetical protein FO519_002583 [Halicephalobus sp. NKZ332]